MNYTDVISKLQTVAGGRTSDVFAKKIETGDKRDLNHISTNCTVQSLLLF